MDTKSSFKKGGQILFFLIFSFLVHTFYSSYTLDKAFDVFVRITAQGNKIECFIISEKILSSIQRLIIQLIGKSCCISRIL